MSRIISLLLVCIISLSFFVACSEEKKEYPGAVIVTQSALVGYKEYVSKTETSLTITITESMFLKALPEDEQAQKKYIAIVDAASFPEKQEDGVIEAGGVYENQIEKIIPKDRKIVEIILTGSQINKLAERTVKSMLQASDGGTYDDRYYHFTGVAFVYDTKKQEGQRIIDSAMAGDSKIVATEKYNVVLNSQMVNSPRFKSVVGVAEEFEFEGYKEIANEYDTFIAHIKEHGISMVNPRMIDKAERDAPLITIIVLISLAVLALGGIITAYFVMKKKQKVAKAKRGGQPRIDV